MSSYKTTVGIEVHAELKTESKMFCACRNEPHAAEPNMHICPVCMAHPGTLPTVNKQAVSYLFQIGKAIGGTLAEYSEFDRKNYFYPDIPKAYQISQLQFPFVTGGELGGVAITRIHLEEDTARSQHDQGDGSLVDFNRAGVPLMELVTEPVIHDSKEAGDFAKELQLMLRTLGLSDANMEKGEMRVEANISVSKDDTLGTKVEVKNLNSFKSVESAIDFETKRQIELIEKGELVLQETRGWDENKGKSFSQRMKESADDYRYFPDPDIPKFLRSQVPEFSDSRVSEIIKKTPSFKRNYYANLGLPVDQIEIIISDNKRDKFVLEALESVDKPESIAKAVANYFTSDVLSIIDSGDVSLETANPSYFAQLVRMVSQNEITSRVAKDILKEVVFECNEPNQLAKSRNLLQQNNADELVPLIKSILADNQSVVDEYRSGKGSAIQFLVGQGMKVTRGSANPAVLLSLLIKEIESQK